MRLRLVVMSSIAIVLGIAFSARAQAMTTIHLHADRIAFYNDRFLLEADGNVHITTSDGLTIRGDAFSMDLRLNRFLVASNVHLHSKTGSLDGAAISDFLSFNRVYFVPIIEKPDRWTYVDGDYSTPLKGREMPGDAFYFPNLGKEKPDVVARDAEVGAGNYLRMQSGTARFVGAEIPIPSFYTYFGTNPYMGQNSLSGANFDLTYNVAGNANSISAVHARDDLYNGSYLSYEQHFASQRAYAVFSVNPATKYRKWTNLAAGEKIGNHFEATVFAQLFTQQYFIERPYASAASINAQLVQGLAHSSLSATFTQTYYNLIGLGHPIPSPAIPDHPFQMIMSWTSTPQHLFKSPLLFQLTSGLGFNEDVFGLQNYGGVDYQGIWDRSVGYTAYLPSAKIGNHDNPYKTYYFNFSVNHTRTFYSVPHHVNATTTTESLSRQFSRALSAYASYSAANTGDYYKQGGYVPYAPIGPDGNPVLSFLAFRGVATLRTSTLGFAFQPTPDFSSTLTFTHHDDFPIAVPGLYPLPQTNVLGQYLSSNYLGQPPWQLAGDVRARILPHLVMDVARTYYFNYGTLRWSPTFTVQFSQ